MMHVDYKKWNKNIPDATMEKKEKESVEIITENK